MHRLHIPAPPLASLVRCFWYWEGAPQPHARERLMPSGEATMVFNLRDDGMRLYDADDFDRYTSCGWPDSRVPAPAVSPSIPHPRTE